MPTLRALSPVAMPAVVLVTTLLGVLASRRMPDSISGLGVYAPYVLLFLGAAISLWFNRGRALVALVSLLAGYAGFRMAMDGAGMTFAARAAFTALTLFVPLNILLALLLPERGVSHFRNYRWMLLLLAEVLLASWIAGAGTNALSGTAWHGLLDHWLIRAAPVPLLGRLLMAAAFAVAATRAWPRRSPLDVGMAGALVALFIACQWPASQNVFGAFMAAAGAILLIAILQESHRMAFRDELTGLPGRRALEEKLVALGPNYVIAMVDVDHFKQFNDTHGHDIGDQVLKMVGTRLAEAQGVGRAFRYGGEEFSVLFPDLTLKQALPQLEALRQSIESYQMAVRTTERRIDSRDGKDRRTTVSRPRKSRADEVHAFRRPDLMLSVTVSIGVAQRTDNLDTPARVIKAADEALYRAKEAGRNRVST